MHWQLEAAGKGSLQTGQTAGRADIQAGRGNEPWSLNKWRCLVISIILYFLGWTVLNTNPDLACCFKCMEVKPNQCYTKMKVIRISPTSASKTAIQYRLFLSLVHQMMNFFGWMSWIHEWRSSLILSAFTVYRDNSITQPVTFCCLLLTWSPTTIWPRFPAFCGFATPLQSAHFGGSAH